MYQIVEYKPRHAWNKGKIVGQKPPLKLKEIWAIRIRLQMEENNRDIALFNLALDSKLRACDLVKMKVSDISHNGRVSKRAIVMQQKTKKPVQFELTQQTRESVEHWISINQLQANEHLFPSKTSVIPHLSTR
jgi:integrase